MPTNSLTLLGTKGGPSLKKGSPSPSSSLLKMNDQDILIDCGIGAARSLVEAGTPLSDLDAIFITHLHSDHILELGPLIYTAWTSGLVTPLDIYGPIGLAEYWEHFLKSMRFDHSIRTIDDKRQPLDELINIHIIMAETKLELNGIAVSFLRVDHPPVEQCYAMRFVTTDHKITFSADTCYFLPLAEFAKGADILVHEAMLGKGVDALVDRMKGAPGLKAHLLASHTMAEDVGRIAASANITRLVLNHLVPSDDPAFTDDDWKSAVGQNWSGPVIVGHDGLIITF